MFVFSSFSPEDNQQKYRKMQLCSMTKFMTSIAFPTGPPFRGSDVFIWCNVATRNLAVYERYYLEWEYLCMVSWTFEPNFVNI